MPAGVYTRTAEHNANMSKATVARFSSKEERAKISAKLMGHGFSEEAIIKMRATKRKHPYIPSQEARDKMSKIMKGRIFTEEWRAKLKLARAKQVITEETKAKLRTYRIGVTLPKEARIKLSKAGKRNWGNPLYKEAQIKAQRLAMSIHPNKPEAIIMGMLESICPGEFKFVGDGQVIIAGKNPDFININGHKQIVELFGDYWHSKEVIKSSDRTEKGRIKLFKQYGFDTLIIWERELKTPAKVAERITNFTKRNCFEGLLKETA